MNIRRMVALVMFWFAVNAHYLHDPLAMFLVQTMALGIAIAALTWKEG